MRVFPLRPLLLVLTTVFSPLLFAQKQDFGNRFEGAFLENGNDQFKVVGVMRAPVEFAPNGNIWVKFFLPPGNLPKSDLQIEAQELVDLHAYAMQSKPKSFPARPGTWNSFGPWPAKDVLGPLEIEAANLAVTASFVDDGGTQTYLPVVARTDNLPASNTYTFEFKVASNIHSLRKSLIMPDGSETALTTSECTFSPTYILYDAGTTQAISLDMKNYQEGRYQLHLEGNVPGCIKPVAGTITFYHRKA